MYVLWANAYGRGSECLGQFCTAWIRETILLLARCYQRYSDIHGNVLQKNSECLAS